MLYNTILVVLLLVGITSTSPSADEKYCYGREDICEGIRDFLKLNSQKYPYAENIIIVGNINDTTWKLVKNANTLAMARCDFAGMAFKHNTTALHIINSCFPKVTRESFKGVTNLTFLRLFANHGPFEDGAFKDLKNLQYLIITNQSIPRLQKSLLEGPDHLLHLTLNSNNMTEIDENVFDDHQENLVLINLDDNPLETFKPNLSKIPKLFIISLLNTNIKQISFDASGHSSLRSLQIPKSVLLHNFNITRIRFKFPNLGLISILNEDFASPDIKPIKKILDGYNVGLDNSSRTRYVDHDQPELETLWNPPSIC